MLTENVLSVIFKKESFAEPGVPFPSDKIYVPFTEVFAGGLVINSSL